MGAKKLNIKQVLKLHQERREALDVEYNPYVGIGSPLKRFELVLGKNRKAFLPETMKNEPIVQIIEKYGGEEEASKETDMALGVIQHTLFGVRIKHDYEYWCAMCVKIEDAETNELIPFILNAPQLISLRDREEMRLANEPVRQIELKHRQYGSSTEKNCYTFWVQNVLTNGLNAYLCSLDKSGAGEILRRYEIIAKNYPKPAGKFSLKGYKGMQNTQEVVGSNSIVNIGSAENPNAPSGRTVQVILLSEVGKMKSTMAKGANKLITNMVSMVRMAPNTFILMESTAEEAGAYFRRQVFRAKRGESGFKLTFISWITDPRCQVMLDASKYVDFIESLSKYEWELWELGASLDQINWWRLKCKEYDHVWEMQQENPATVEEAFAGAGKKKFPTHIINKAKETVCEPEYIGEIVGNADIGEESIEGLRFVPNVKGELKIWIHPEDYPTPKPVSGRFAMYVDIGGKGKESDYSVIKVVDRSAILEGGVPECACEWRGHCDPTVLAWKSAQIAMWYTIDYDYPLLAVEYNALNARGNNTEGVHYLTVFNEIGKYYPNLFTRKDVSKVKNKTVTHYGFYLSYASKTMIVNSLSKAWEFGGYIEHSEVTIDEASYFEIKEDNTLGAVEGEHDDSLIASGGAYWLASDYMEPPMYIEREEIKPYRVASEAVF